MRWTRKLNIITIFFIIYILYQYIILKNIKEFKFIKMSIGRKS